LIALLGATGFIGSAVLTELLASGHEVRALARNPSEFVAPEHLTVIAGDARDRAVLDTLLEGVDAVISAIGTPRGAKSEPGYLADAMTAVIDAMARHQVRRIVAISGAGINVPGEPKPFPHGLASAIVGVLARSAVQAKQREFEVLRGSDAEWTAVRPTRIVPGQATGKVKVDREIGMQITVGDVAQFMVAQLGDPTYVRRAPIISG